MQSPPNDGMTGMRIFLQSYLTRKLAGGSKTLWISEINTGSFGKVNPLFFCAKIGWAADLAVRRTHARPAIRPS